MRGPHTAVVTPAGTRDNFGDPIAAGTPHEVEGCLLGPAESTETQNRGDVVVTTWRLYAPAGSVIPATARVVVDGITAQVDGDPESWPSGVIARLKRASG